MEKNKYRAYRKQLNIPLRKLEDTSYIVEDSLFIEGSDHYKPQLGLVGGQEVLDVVALNQGYKIHLKGLPENDLQEINWPQRLQFMQFSLARVLYSLAFNHLLSIKTLNFTIEDRKARILLAAKDLPYTSLDRIEALVAHTIQANLLVSQTKIDQGVLVRVADYPLQKSQGPHLIRTGEIGLSRINHMEKTDEGLALDFICGGLAHKDYLQLAKDMADLSTFLRCPIAQVKDHVQRRITSGKDKLSQKTDALSSSGDQEAQAPKSEKPKDSEAKNKNSENLDHPKNQENLRDPGQEKSTPPPKDKEAKEDDLALISLAHDLKAQASQVGDLHYIYQNLRDLSSQEIKEVSAKIMDEDNYIQIYGLPSPDRSFFLACLSKNRREDLKKIFDQIKDDYPMEGSGNYLRIHGYVDTDQLANVMEQFLAGIQGQIEAEKEG